MKKRGRTAQKKFKIRRHSKPLAKKPLQVLVKKHAIQSQVTNEANVGNVSGVINIIIQIPIQIGANAANLEGSDQNTNTTI